MMWPFLSIREKRWGRDGKNKKWTYKKKKWATSVTLKVSQDLCFGKEVHLTFDKAIILKEHSSVVKPPILEN